VTSCDGVDSEVMTSLLELGQATGTCVLLSTTSTTYAASLAAHVGTTVKFGCTGSAECRHAVSVERGRVAPGAFTLTSVRSPDACVSGQLVPIALGSRSAVSAEAW
jgi:hypothetical protein